MREKSHFAFCGLEETTEKELREILLDSHLNLEISSIPLDENFESSLHQSAHEFDGIVVNAQGGNISLVDFLTEIRKKYPLTEIVLIFFAPNYHLLLSMIRLGMTDVVNYPYERNEVFSVFENTINRRFFSQKTRPLNRVIELIELFAKSNVSQNQYDLFTEAKNFINDCFNGTELFILSVNLERDSLKEGTNKRRKSDTLPFEIYWNRDYYNDSFSSKEKKSWVDFFIKEKERLLQFDFSPCEIGNKSFYIINLGACEQKHYYGILHLDVKELRQHELDVIGHFSRIMYGLFQKMIHFQLEGKLNLLAHIDDVTGLYNQRKLQIDLDRLMLRYQDYGEAFSILFIDIDYFKTVNDRYGHLIGSLLLVETSKEFKKVVRDSDLLYRYGGDEFVIILDNTKGTDAKIVAQRILESITKKKFSKRFHRLITEPFSISVSIGVAEFPTDADSKEAVLRMADDMMYKAKKSGRGMVCFTERLLDLDPSSSQSSKTKERD